MQHHTKLLLSILLGCSVMSSYSCIVATEAVSSMYLVCMHEMFT